MRTLRETLLGGPGDKTLPKKRKTHSQFEEITESTSGSNEGREDLLIPVKMEAVVGHKRVRPCPMCKRMPSSEEIKTGRCATCNYKLETKHKLKCSLFRVLLLFTWFLIVLLSVGFLFTVINYGFNKQARDDRFNFKGYLFPIENQTIECEVYGFQSWTRWNSSCSRQCGTGVRSKHRNVSATGNFCAPSETYELCQNGRCCPAGWSGNNSFGTGCYKFFKHKRAFTDATEYCINETSQLTTPHTDEEWNALMAVLKHSRSDDAWLGIDVGYKTEKYYYDAFQKEQLEVSFTYIDDKEAVEYTRWDQEQPSASVFEDGRPPYCVYTLAESRWILLSGSQCTKKKKTFVCNMPTSRTALITYSLN